MNTISKALLPRPVRRRGGFTLVEVTLAIGIVGFAFVTLFGLVPTGLNLFRNAIDTSIGSQILEQITDNAQQTDFDELLKQRDTPAPDRWYDDQGNDITELYRDKPTQYNPLYTARVQVVWPVSLPSATTSSDADPSAAPDPRTATTNVVTLKVLIAKNPNHTTDPFTNNKTTVNAYSAHVARNTSPSLSSSNP